MGLHGYRNLVSIEKGLNNDEADRRARALAKAAAEY